MEVSTKPGQLQSEPSEASSPKANARPEWGHAPPARHLEMKEVIDEPWFHFDKPAIEQAAALRDCEIADTLLDRGSSSHRHRPGRAAAAREAEGPS